MSDDYTMGMIQFENNRAGKLMAAIDEMEKDRLAGWNAFFRKDYQYEEVVDRLKNSERENQRLSKLVEELLCRKECRKSTKK